MKKRLKKRVQQAPLADVPYFGNTGQIVIKLKDKKLSITQGKIALCTGIVKDDYLYLIERPHREHLRLAVLKTVSDIFGTNHVKEDGASNVDFLDILKYHLDISDLFEDVDNDVGKLNIKLEKESFKGRQFEEASAFLKRVYADELRAGTLYQHQLRKRDPKLMQALSNEFAGRRDKLREILPPKKKETDELLRQAGIEPSSPVRRAAAAALRKEASPTV